MQVVGAGLGRTGTLSLKQALEDLGFGPCYHMQEVMRRPSHVRRWLDYAETGDAQWDELFDSFESGVDYPVANVWSELAEHYPEAKVILTVRDPERWWESTNSTIYGFRTAFAPWFRTAVPHIGRFVNMVDKYVWEGLFGGRFTERDHAIAVFNEHADHVRATCPPERLLEFEVAQGWEPLCLFLDVPVPDKPFPHLNDTAETKRIVTSMYYFTRALPFVAAAAVAGAVISSSAS